MTASAAGAPSAGRASASPPAGPSSGDGISRWRTPRPSPSTGDARLASMLLTRLARDVMEADRAPAGGIMAALADGQSAARAVALANELVGLLAVAKAQRPGTVAVRRVANRAVGRRRRAGRAWRSPLVEWAGSLGEDPAIAERIVVASTDGRFRPLPCGRPRIGAIVVEGQTLGFVDQLSAATPVRSAFTGQLMGMLALPGQPVWAGHPIAWLRAGC
jgi:hypothetical protein